MSFELEFKKKIFVVNYSQCLDILEQNRQIRITEVLSTGWHNLFPPHSKLTNIITCTNEIFD